MTSEENLIQAFQAKVTVNNNSGSSDNEDDHLVTIDIDDKVIKCDRRLLIQHSKYFEALFAFRKGTKASGPLERVRLKGAIDYESARVILSAMCGSDVLVNGENAQSILQASTFLQCPLAERAAADYMLSNLSLSNAFSVFLLGLNCGSVYLAEKAEAYILHQVQTFQFRIESSMDVLAMPVDKLKQYLNVLADNGVAFGVICGWVFYDIENRKIYLESLLKTFIVVEILAPEAIEAIEVLESEPVITEALKEAQKYEQLPLRAKIKHWESLSSKSCLDKWPRMAIVCSTGNNSPLITYRSSYGSRWLKLTTKPAKLNVKSSGSVVASVSYNQCNCLYFIGGVGNLQMWSYNIKSDQWKLLSVDQDERIRPLVCGLGSDIYVFGGYTDAHKEVTYLNSASKFDTLNGTWTSLSVMERSRSGGQACAMDGNIYLFGGLCSRRRALVACEVYNIEKDEFKSLTNLPLMIIDFGLVLVKNQRKIYVIGGMDPLTFETKNTVLVFDLKTLSWTFDFPSLNVARKSFGCYYDGDTLYAVAGSTAELDQLSSVERFNPLIGKWELIDGLPKGLAASTASVVSDLPVRLMANYREFGQSTMSS